MTRRCDYSFASNMVAIFSERRRWLALGAHFSHFVDKILVMVVVVLFLLLWLTLSINRMSIKHSADIYSVVRLRRMQNKPNNYWKLLALIECASNYPARFVFMEWHLLPHLKLNKDFWNLIGLCLCATHTVRAWWKTIEHNVQFIVDPMRKCGLFCLSTECKSPWNMSTNRVHCTIVEQSFLLCSNSRFYGQKTVILSSIEWPLAISVDHYSKDSY